MSPWNCNRPSRARTSVAVALTTLVGLAAVSIATSSTSCVHAPAASEAGSWYQISAGLALEHVPSPWAHVGSAPADADVVVGVHLRQHRLAELEARVSEVSSPWSPRFGQYLSRHEIDDIVRASPAVRKQVHDWLATEGVSIVRDAADHVVFRAPAERVQRLFRTCLSSLASPHGSVQARAVHASVHVPAKLKDEIDLVTGLYHMHDIRRAGKTKPEWTAADAAAAAQAGPVASIVDPTGQHRCISRSGNVWRNCTAALPTCGCMDTCGPANQECVDGAYYPVCPFNGACGNGSTCCEGVCVPAAKCKSISQKKVTPEVLREFYHVPRSAQAVHPNTSQCVVAFNAGGKQQRYNEQSLKNFLDFFSLPKASVTNVYPFTSCTGDGCEQTESDLDMQYMLSIGAGGDTGFWSMPEPYEWILEWAQEVSQHDNVPVVYSISYGAPENSHHDRIAYNVRANGELVKLAARGITVIASSGDNGALNTADGSVVAMFPASSPYVTGVGATMLSQFPNPACRALDSSMCPMGEAVASTRTNSLITSGGGASLAFAQPAWQANAVAAYLSSGVPMPNITVDPRSQRMVPDVAINGNNFQIISGTAWNGTNAYSMSGVWGTSCSAPTFAGLITLINDARFLRNLPAVGFLNPTLYDVAQRRRGAFNDIVVGDNFCAESSCYPQGYYASVGWDATTGLGSPNFNELFEHLVTEALVAKNTTAAMNSAEAALSLNGTIMEAVHSAQSYAKEAEDAASKSNGDSTRDIAIVALVFTILTIFGLAIAMMRRRSGRASLDAPLFVTRPESSPSVDLTARTSGYNVMT